MESVKYYLVQVVLVLKELIPVVAPAVTATVAIFGLQVARRGLHTWRLQLRGGAEYALARRVLVGVYRTRAEIDHTRRAILWSHEMESALEASGRANDPMDATERAKAGEFAAYSRRLGRLVEAVVQLQTESLEAEALWGDDWVRRMPPLLDCVNELHFSIQFWLEHRHDRENRIDDREELKRYYSVVFDHSVPEKADEFRQKVCRAIGDIEAFLRPKLKNPITT